MQLKCAIFREALLAWGLTLDEVRPAVVGAALTASVMRLRRLDYVTFVGDVPVRRQPSLTPIFWEPATGTHLERDRRGASDLCSLEAYGGQFHQGLDLAHTALNGVAAAVADTELPPRAAAAQHIEGGLDAVAVGEPSDINSTAQHVKTWHVGHADLPEALAIPDRSRFPDPDNDRSHLPLAVASAADSCSSQDVLQEAEASQRCLQPSTVLMMPMAKFAERYPRFERWLRRRQRSAFMEGREDFWCGKRLCMAP
jgi:hypothetical protein